MVFEGGPLEADAVEDSSPPLLLRPIMWMLGSGGASGSGSDTTQEENTNNENTCAIPCSTDEDDENDDDDDDDVHLIKSRSPPRYMSQSSPPPGVVRVSEAEIDGSSSEEEESPAFSSANAAETLMAALSLSESTQGIVNSSSSPKSRSAGSLHQRLHPSSRKLSWSDRAGGDLATYSAYDVSNIYRVVGYFLYVFAHPFEMKGDGRQQCITTHLSWRHWWSLGYIHRSFNLTLLNVRIRIHHRREVAPAGQKADTADVHQKLFDEKIFVVGYFLCS